MKAHLGVDSKTKLIHAVVATPASVHDSQVLPNPLHGAEPRVWGDSAYTGPTGVIRKAAPWAKDFTHEKGARGHPFTPEQKAKNKNKSKLRAKGEHTFLIIKRIFGFMKVR